MKKELSPGNIYKSFLELFVEKGVTEIPYDFIVLRKLLNNALPNRNNIDSVIEDFQLYSMTSVDSLEEPKHIVILDLSRYNEKISLKERLVARKIKKDYLKLIA